MMKIVKILLLKNHHLEEILQMVLILLFFIRKIMAKFIELTQHIQNLGENYDRKIRVNIEHIDFYYDQHIVFEKRAIDVFESYEEITKLINNETRRKITFT